MHVHTHTSTRVVTFVKQEVHTHVRCTCMSGLWNDTAAALIAIMYTIITVHVHVVTDAPNSDFIVFISQQGTDQFLPTVYHIV